MTRKVKLEVKGGMFFKLWLELLSVTPPFSKLTPRERELTAYLMEYYDRFKHLSKEERDNLLQSKNCKEFLMKSMNLPSLQMLYNMTFSLKKKGVLINGTLDNKYIISPAAENNLIFNIKYA